MFSDEILAEKEQIEETKQTQKNLEMDLEVAK